MSELRNAVAAYMEAFARKDIIAIETMLSDDVTLQDPVVGLVRGKEQVLATYRDLFAGGPLRIELMRYYETAPQSAAQEFRLHLTNTDGSDAHVSGVDLIEYSAGRISSLRAYLDTRPE